MVSRLRWVARAVRPPRPGSVRGATFGLEGEAHVSLAAGRDVASCVANLRALGGAAPVGTTLIVPAETIGPRIGLPVMAWMAETSRVSVGLPQGFGRRSRRRWGALAGRLGLEAVSLGERGWDRVELDDRSEILGYVDLPAELGTYDEIVIVGLGIRRMMAVWRSIAHPNSAMRAWASGAVGTAELAMGIEARYVLVLDEDEEVVVMAECRDRVAAQLICSGWERVREESSGVEAEGPWEETETQSLVALAGGIALPAQVVIHADAADTGSEGRFQRLAELIGSQIVWRSRHTDDEP